MYFQTSVVELKRLSQEDAYGSLLQHAALHALVVGTASMREIARVLHYCTEKDIVGCGSKLFVSGWCRKAFLPRGILEAGGACSMLLRCLIICTMERQLFPTAASSVHDQRQWLLDHRQTFFPQVGSQSSIAGHQLDVYHDLLTEACARHLEDCQHSLSEVVRVSETRVKVRAIAYMFGR